MKNVLVLAALVLLVGCSKKSSPEATDKATPASSTSVAAAEAPLLPPKAPEPKGGGAILTLGDRLVAEQGSRPDGTPKAEAVYDAFEKAGIKITERKQHVAKIYGAMFCLGAKTDIDLHYSVCEYETPTAAVQGRESATKAFASVPNRQLADNKKTVLTVRQPPVKTPKTEEVAKKSFEIFAKM